MKNKGFTLAEILGVIVIIGILLVITGPIIVSRIREKGKEAEETGYELIYNAAEQLVSEDESKYPKGHSDCIEIKELVELGKLSSPVLNIKTGENLENKSVLVKRTLSGYDSYSIHEKEECEKMKKVDPIDIAINQSECVGSNIGTKITITYPTQIGTNYKHTDEDGKEVNDNINIDNRIVEVIYKKNTTIKAQFEYNGETIIGSGEINNIDDIKPKIESLTPNGNSNWIKSSEITVKVKEEGCGLKNNQTVRYGWTQDKNQTPESLLEAQLTNTNSKNGQIKIPVSGLTGTYYLYISGGIEDTAGNKSDSYISKAFKFDNTPPSCGTWTGESTTWTNSNRTIKVGCTDTGSGCTSSSYTVKSYTSGTTQTQPLKKAIEDKVGNEMTCRKTANVYVDKVAPTISYSKLSGTYRTETLPYKGYTFYYKDNSGGSGLKKFSTGEYFQAYAITTSGCNSGWKAAGSDLCTNDQNNRAEGFWRAYRVKDNAGNVSKIVCSYLSNGGSYVTSGPSEPCTVNGKPFTN